MAPRQKKFKFNVIRFLGFVVLPLISGALLGVLGAYIFYNRAIADIESECLSEVNIEYGHEITLDCFFTEIPPNTDFITSVDKIDTGMLASYDIAIDCGGHVVHSILNVIDCTGPTANPVPVEMYAGKAPEPKTLVKDVFDLTDVHCTYNNGEPDLTKGGNFDIGVRLTDTNGNFSVIDVPFYIKQDVTAPVISGVHDIDVMVGSESVSYRDGVTVTDDFAENPTLEIDNSQVDLAHVGDYPLTYTATDDVGNMSTVTVKIHVIPIANAEVSSAVTQAYVDEAYRMAREINAKILDDDDTDVEKAMKIFYWVHKNISFILSTPEYGNWAVAAINTFTKRYSSCYGTWSVCKAMLDVEGIENICVIRERKNSWDNIHYWALVKLNGEWYHCDAQKYFNDYTPKGYFCFMMTDKEIINAPTNHNFAKDKYPDRSTTSVQNYINVYRGTINSNFPYKD
ncbi:MAG: transglutaminase domain-containing protein [Clostridiales bacterium]|nr:transglutaminase domain-containing protein [Clostridiales bacterium]